MSQTIARMFGSHDKARAAVDALKLEGYEDADIKVVPESAAGVNGMSSDDIAGAIMKGYVLRWQAKRYAEGVRKGGTLVAVNAPFGMAVKAAEIMDGVGTIDSGIAEDPIDYLVWEEGAPLSSTIRMPTLMDDGTPFATFWNLPSLTKGRASIWAALGISELANPNATYLSMGGLLSDNPAPLSSIFKLPLLTQKKR